MDYSARLAGSSVFPFSIIGKSILGFLFLMVIIHLIVNFMRHDLPPKSRKKLTTKIGGGILSIALAIAIGFGLYWLVPPPHVIRTTPNRGSAKATQDGRIEVVFDRPVSRTEMKKTITPETPGVWVFEQPTYNTHLTRKVVFYPQETLSPDTEYTITLSGISNTLKLSTPYNYEYSFRTHKDPIVEKVIPGNGERLQETGIKIFLSESAEGSHIELEFFPTISFETKLDSERRVITVIPREKLEPSAHYRMKVFLTDMRKDLSTKEMIEEGQLAEVFDGSFQTQGLPGIASVIPVGGQVAIDDTVAVRFTKPMNKQSVEQNFLIEPEVEGKIDWADDYLLVFNPEKYEYNTKYTVAISGKALTATGEALGNEVLGHFTTLGEVGVEKIMPANGDLGVGINTPIKVTLNQEVSRPSAEANFSVTPSLKGKFSWLGRTMVFTPEQPLNKNTTYLVKLDPGVKSLKGLDSEKGFVAGFSTTQTTFKLPVPAYLQQHSLSCEVASLRMALVYRGINASEEELLNRVGYDPTPHSGGLWGNPYTAFVGNVDGKQMTTGYGVYWGPIARVARSYTQASEFSGWTTKQLLTEVAKGNPVIVWGYSGGGRAMYWNTPSGEKIYAVTGEHTYVVVGFVGTPENPSRIIVNDSLVGQVYMTKQTFEKKWNAFGKSGVVVY